MRILLINYSDIGGGAPIAVNRLLTELIKKNIDVTLGVVNKNEYSDYTIDLSRNLNFFQKILRKFYRVTFDIFSSSFKTTNKIIHSTNNLSIIDINKINNSNFDLVNFHWINNNTISIKDIAKIKKPIVWTMHDSWPCCGAEHHPNILEKDMRYISGYTKKNKPKTTKGFDLCKYVFIQKKKYLKEKNIVFVTPSNWEKDVLKASYLFNKKKCCVIPNIIDFNIFKPLELSDVTNFKNNFNLSTTKKTLCFGAAYSLMDMDSIKGGKYLINAIQQIQNPEDYQLIIFGPKNKNFEKLIKIKTFFTGFIQNPEILRIFYAISDLFICPSIIENLPYTCLESICCGTPVVAFHTGGIPDIIEHKFNGYLATPFDSNDLYNGIEHVLEHKDVFSNNCILKAKRDFSTDKSVKMYIDLYNAVINGDTKSL